MDTNITRYIIVNSNRFFGHYDILDTKTGKREPQGTLSVRWIQYEVNALNSKSIIKQEITMTNEYKSLTDEQVGEMYDKACQAILTMSPFMAINDKLHLKQRQRQLREEYIKRVNGQ